MTGPQIPPPPPAPPLAAAVASMSVAEREALDAALKRQRKDERFGKAKQTVGRMNGRHWWSLATIGGLAVLAVGCNQYVSMQNATLDAQVAQSRIIAEALQPTATSQPASTPRGMPNPLEALPLTEQARWAIGLGEATREDGQRALLTARSSSVVSQMMRLVDPCKLWVSVNDKLDPVVSTEQTPGAVPMAECKPPATTTTTDKPAQ